MPNCPIKVLLVDDDEDDFIITRDLISHIGVNRFQLQWINNYTAALEAIKRGEHDICLLDYRLGERTGLELLREAYELNCNTPMILLTGQGDREVDVEAMKAGAADYLIKSHLNADTLERAIRYAIEGKRAEECLRRERDLISRMMETSPVGILMADRTGKITFANSRAEKVLALSREAIASRNFSVLDWQATDIEGHPLSKQFSSLQQVLDSGQPVQNIRHSVEADGRRVLLSTNAAPIFDSAGKIDGMVITVEDITERLNLESQLLQSQKMESIGQLAAGVAHDINNVLTVIQGHAGLLLNVAPPNSESVKSLKQISAASERAARFIQQLLLFSRKQVIKSQALDLNSIVHNLENMLSRMVGEDISLEVAYLPDLPRVEADTGMIEQIVMNLAVNARDAMPKGGKLSLATSCSAIDAAYVRQHPEARVGNFICLTVSDTGSGIDRRILQRIFEPFFSTKEPGKGTGLGLATVYGIVKQHRGWIQVESEIGIGTIFNIYLPVASPTAKTNESTTEIRKKIIGGKETILFVEDEPGLRELVQKVLSQFHYNVLVAPSGIRALEIWAERFGKIDLLLTDVILPGGMTGRDIATELKKRNPFLKVIYTSGYGPEMVGKDFGDATFLPKPFESHHLAQIVRTCLDTLTKSTKESIPILANTFSRMAALTATA